MEDFETSQVCMQCVWMDVDVVFPLDKSQFRVVCLFVGLAYYMHCLSALQLQESLTFFFTFCLFDNHSNLSFSP